MATVIIGGVANAMLALIVAASSPPVFLFARLGNQLARGSRDILIAHWVTVASNYASFASGHTLLNTPDPIRTRKLSSRRPGQYWGGGPPGKPLGAAGFCWLKW